MGDSVNKLNSLKSETIQMSFNMDKKVVCVFLLMVGLGISHGLQCYGGIHGLGIPGAHPNFDPFVFKGPCYDEDDVVCAKVTNRRTGRVDRGCENFQNYIDGYATPVPKHNGCTDVVLDVHHRRGIKVEATVCVCTTDFCNN